MSVRLANLSPIEHQGVKVKQLSLELRRDEKCTLDLEDLAFLLYNPNDRIKKS